MLNDNHRVAYVDKLAQHTDQALRVAWMKTYAGLVEDIKRTYESRAKAGCQVYALTLAAREAVATAAEGEISQPHIDEELQAAAYLHKKALGHGSVVSLKLQGVEPFLEHTHWHVDKFGDATPSHLDESSLATQACAMAVGALSLARISREHDAVLNLIASLAKIVEKEVDAHVSQVPAALQAFIWVAAVPQEVALFVGKFVVGLEDRKSYALGHPDELCLPLAHLLAAPTLDATFVHALGRIGNDEVRVDARDVAPPLARRTSAHRRIEGKELVRGLVEGHAVGLEARREHMLDACRQEAQHQLAAAFVERSL